MLIESLTECGFSKEISTQLIESPKYVKGLDICFIPMTNNIITDIPIIIHELIHQYYNNKKKEERYSQEIPSTFFESVAMIYLIKNGYEQYEKTIKEQFLVRMFLRFLGQDRISVAEITKKKYDNAEITEKNIICNGKTTTDKRKNAKRYINFLKNKCNSNDEEVRISYALGTLFAKRYSNNKNVIERMLQFIKDPEYSLQSLMDDIQNEEKNKTIEEEIENGQESAPSFPC